MNKNELDKKKIIILAIIFFFASFIIVKILIKSVEDNKVDKKIKEGIEFLRKESKKDADLINKQVQASRKETLVDNAVKNTEQSLQIFDNSLVIGDSRAYGYRAYELLPKEQVIAKSGAHIDDVLKYEAEIKNFNPTRIFLAFGLNDVGMRGKWADANAYAGANADVIRTLQEWVPGAVIYLNSILPCTDAVAQGDAYFKEVPDYNEALKKMCADNGFNYVDNTGIVADHKDMYQADGEHFVKDFYYVWTANMYLTVVSVEDR